MNALGFSHLPPFSPSDGLFERAYRAATTPKAVFTNSATEYWRGDASLAHPEPDGPDWRFYLYAGADHIGQMPFAEQYVASLAVQFPANLVDTAPLVRAHFAALEEWVVDGREPPPSAVPRVDDGTGIDRRAALDALASVPWLRDVTPPDPQALLGMPPVDLGPGADSGVGVFPPTVTGPFRPCLVSACDADGNEEAGVRLPAVSVPLGVLLGWNPEHPRGGAPVELWNLLGGRVQFPADEILRRYSDRDRYLTMVEAAALDLINRRHVLAEDKVHLITSAEEAWDRALSDLAEDRPTS
jgi:hypothetical protein